MHRDVEFATGDGTRLVGRIHRGGEGPAPGIVMCHGFGGVQSQIDHYAAHFAAAGFSVLIYDHRNFGFSDGLPRQDIVPHTQLSDWRDAIGFAATQVEFDPDAGFGIWGSSFAGGLALVIAASDPSVRCVVAQIPNVCGRKNGVRLFSAEEREEIRRLSALDRIGRMDGADPIKVPLFPTQPGEFAAFSHGLPDGLLARASETPTWANEVTVRSLEHLLDFEPAAWAPYISPKPVMMIVGEEDVCTFAEVQLEVFEGLREPKSLVTFPGGHFEAYSRFFRETAGPARAWFEQHLRPVSAEPQRLARPA